MPTVNADYTITTSDKMLIYYDDKGLYSQNYDFCIFSYSLSVCNKKFARTERNSQIPNFNGERRKRINQEVLSDYTRARHFLGRG